jgi:UDP:flavonoid glycosyltransferase YjiC (YdhE family)
LFRGQFSPMLNLALFPAALAPVRGDWPPNTVLTGFPRFDGKPIQGAQREALERFLDGGPAPIVFALGSSVVMIAGTFWEKALEASLRTGRRAILLTGTPLATQLPSSVAAFDYVPYSAIFARSSVVVHQAGIGTLAQALASGRPQLAVPVAFDQPDNARRVVALGVGRSVPMNKVTAVTLARELTHLLETPAYAERAQQVVGSFAEGGSERAADALVAALS